jgi:hypothetical protein
VPVFASRVDPSSDEFARNREDMLRLIDEVRTLEARAAAASAANADRFARRGQLTPRERVARLLDPGTPWLELGNLAGYLVDDGGPGDLRARRLADHRHRVRRRHPLHGHRQRRGINAGAMSRWRRQDPPRPAVGAGEPTCRW